MKNIVLIGLSGSGKSTLGELLAQNLNLPFVDLDEAVCQKTGRTIPELFLSHGEEYFRDLESGAVREATSRGGQVIATGGGAILRPENAELLCKNGFMIFLDRPVDSIAGDIQLSGRPLLKAGAEKLYAMEKERRPLYLACAHLVLENNAGQKEALQKLQSACLPLLQSGYAVIGDPIGHSLSPAIYRAAFDFLGEKAPYTALHVPRGTLAPFLAGVRQSGLRGFNATIPHKRDIIPLLDEVSPDAALCGAVNTVAKQNGKLCGYNTDMEGLNLSLKQAGHGFSGRRTVILGAGGAAWAVALKAALEKAETLHILARREQAAQELASQVQKATEMPVSWGEMQPENLCAAAAQCDLLLNCTPLGMQGIPQDFDDLSFVNHLPKTAFVCDLIYKPAQTHLLAAAQNRGLETLNGLGMLIFQAILAMEIYLSKPLAHQELYAVIHNTLIEKEETTL